MKPDVFASPMTCFGPIENDRVRRALVVVAASIVAACSGSSTAPPPASPVYSNESASSESASNESAPRFAGAPRDGERFSNLYPFKLSTVGMALEFKE